MHTITPENREVSITAGISDSPIETTERVLNARFQHSRLGRILNRLHC